MNDTRNRLDFQRIKDAARGRWANLLPVVTHVSPEILDGNHHPCPKCGGVDRFRFSDLNGDGSIVCNSCGRTGDGIASVAHLLDIHQGEAACRVAEFLPVNGHVGRSDPVEALARAKRLSPGSLLAYGAQAVADHVEFPMFGPDGSRCSIFSIWPTGTDRKLKGLSAKGLPAGVFLPIVDGLPRLPAGGETWHLAEGVKDAAALWSLGFQTMGMPTCRLSQKFVPLLRGVHAVLVPDRDTAGTEGASSTAAKLSGVAASVCIASLPAELKQSGGADVRDILRRNGGEAALREALAGAREWVPPPSSKNPTGPQRRVGNVRFVKGSGDDKSHWEPLAMPELLVEIRNATDNWPRVAAGRLFVPRDPEGADWISNSASLFGWLQSHTEAPLNWRRVTGAATKEEVFSELKRTATRYQAVEELPHHPLMQGHYYACPEYPSGDGVTLRALLDQFSPASDIDRDLILAALLTPFWGGPSGSRPAFLITSVKGRGVGKSTAAGLIASVAGEALTFDKGDDWGRIKGRLLSPEGQGKRVALLDNVKSPRFSWAELEGLITADVISGHRLFEGEGRRPNNLTWLITLNGASLSTDLAQRVVVIHLDRPTRSDSWEESVKALIRDKRRELVADLLGVLRGPADKLDRFSRWATWERDIVGRLPEPSEAQAIILERQKQTDVEREESELIEEIFRERLAELSYDPELDSVHVPSSIAMEWINKGLGTKDGTTKISTHLNQLADEGRFKFITRNVTHNYGKGTVWRVEGAKIRTDIKDRLARKNGF